jgi:hypothetical protein
MDATILTNEALPELEAELETWDWVRAAGVSADELRQALRASLLEPALRKAA